MINAPVLGRPSCWPSAGTGGIAHPVHRFIWFMRRVSMAHRHATKESHVQVIAFLEFQSAVEEILDVQLLPGLRFPEGIGFQQETIQHTFVVPPVLPDT